LQLSAQVMFIECLMKKVVEWKAWRKTCTARLCLVCVGCLHSSNCEDILFSSIHDDMQMVNLDIDCYFCQSRQHAGSPWAGRKLAPENQQLRLLI